MTAEVSEPRPRADDALSRAGDALSGADDALSVSIASRVEDIVASAEAAAVKVQRDVEGGAQKRADELRRAAEADAARIRRDAEALVGRWLAESRERIDAFTEHRIARIEELTDALVVNAEALQERLETASTVREQVHDLISALGEAAEQIAAEPPGGPDIDSLDLPEAEFPEELVSAPEPPAGPAHVPEVLRGSVRQARRDAPGERPDRG